MKYRIVQKSNRPLWFYIEVQQERTQDWLFHGVFDSFADAEIYLLNIEIPPIITVLKEYDIEDV
jgi:hypothetical protein